MAQACHMAQACRKGQGHRMAWVARMALVVHTVLAGHKDLAYHKGPAYHKGLERHRARDRLDSHKAQEHRHRAQTSAHTRQVVRHVAPGDRELLVPAAVAPAEAAPDVVGPAAEGAAAEAADLVASWKLNLAALSMKTPGLPHYSSRHPGGTRKPAKEDTCPSMDKIGDGKDVSSMAAWTQIAPKVPLFASLLCLGAINLLPVILKTPSFSLKPTVSWRVC